MLSLMLLIMLMLSDVVFYTELELLFFFLNFEIHKFIFKYGKMAAMLDFDFLWQVLEKMTL